MPLFMPGDADITIRTARPEDLKAVHEIELLSFPRPWPRTAFEAELLHPFSEFWVAVHGQTVVGYAILRCYETTGHLINIAVHPDLRRRGIGRRLLEWVIDWARSRRLLAIYLEVRVSNLPAQRLYEHMGFVRAGRIKHYYTPDGEDAWVYRLVVPRHRTSPSNPSKS